jgi:hypothetical protein
MANEILTTALTGYTLYALIWNEDNEVWYNAGSDFETHGTSSRTNADYAISMTEISGTGWYYADYPSLPRGTYNTIVKYQAGANPADSDQSIGGPVAKYWTGSAVVTEPETNAVNICNKALAKLSGGEDTRTITALGDGTPTSDACDLFYTPVRKEVLKRMKPQECTYYADLGDESSFSGEKAEWEYVWDLPSNCLDVIRVTDEYYHRVNYRYEVKQDKIFTNFYTNEDRDSIYIEYVKNETDGDVFSDEVVEAMATLLSSLLAPRIISGERGDFISDKQYEKYEKVVLPTSMGINRAKQHSYEEEQYETKHEWLGDRRFDYD